MKPRPQRWVDAQGVNHAVYEREGDDAFTLCGHAVKGTFSEAAARATERKCPRCMQLLRAKVLVLNRGESDGIKVVKVKRQRKPRYARGA